MTCKSCTEKFWKADFFQQNGMFSFPPLLLLCLYYKTVPLINIVHLSIIHAYFATCGLHMGLFPLPNFITSLKQEAVLKKELSV